MTATPRHKPAKTKNPNNLPSGAPLATSQETTTPTRAPDANNTDATKQKPGHAGNDARCAYFTTEDSPPKDASQANKHHPGQPGSGTNKSGSSIDHYNNHNTAGKVHQERRLRNLRAPKISTVQTSSRRQEPTIPTVHTSSRRQELVPLRGGDTHYSLGPTNSATQRGRT